jgi:hypothetical protein
VSIQHEVAVTPLKRSTSHPQIEEFHATSEWTVNSIKTTTKKRRKRWKRSRKKRRKRKRRKKR